MDTPTTSNHDVLRDATRLSVTIRPLLDEAPDRDQDDEETPGPIARKATKKQLRERGYSATRRERLKSFGICINGQLPEEARKNAVPRGIVEHGPPVEGETKCQRCKNVHKGKNPDGTSRILEG